MSDNERTRRLVALQKPGLYQLGECQVLILNDDLALVGIPEGQSWEQTRAIVEAFGLNSCQYVLSAKGSVSYTPLAEAPAFREAVERIVADKAAEE